MKRGMIILALVLLVSVILIAGCSKEAEEAISDEVIKEEGESVKASEVKTEDETSKCDEISSAVKEICGKDIKLEPYAGICTVLTPENSNGHKILNVNGDSTKLLIFLYKNTSDGSLNEGVEKISGPWDEGYFKTTSVSSRHVLYTYSIYVVKGSKVYWIYETFWLTTTNKDICTKEQYIELMKKVIEIWG